MKKNALWRGISIVAVLMLASLACGFGTTPAPAPPAFDPTKAALEFQGTALALQLTQAALSAGQPVVVAQETAAPSNDPPEPAAVTPTPTQDFQARMKKAKILLYEDTALILDPWIREALTGMGLSYTNVDDYLGHFMENLNSGTDWDLIIVGAEWKEAVRGEFWDVINDQVNNRDTSLIIEVWYLDMYRDAPLRLLLTNCGLQYQSDQGLAESIYWLQPDHPVLNEPNVVQPLIHYARYWDRQAGDKIKLAGSGDATMLAGLKVNDTSASGQIATCYDGRVVVQTFSNHDYHEEQIIPLWQNYIYNTLKARFELVD
jgi:hypothetical protein